MKTSLSFQNWADNPVTTNIETLPIAEAPFPRVTVCPPKNTFTNLNYDLIFASNTSLSTEKRHFFIDTLFAKALDFEYDEAVNLYIQEENGFRNWYDGLTINSHPFDPNNTKQATATTQALSGSMSTPSFSEQFNISAFQNPPEDVDPKQWKQTFFDYNIQIDIDMLSENNEQLFLNVTIDARSVYASAMSTVFDLDFKRIQKDVFWGEDLQNLSDKLFKA